MWLGCKCYLLNNPPSSHSHKSHSQLWHKVKKLFCSCSTQYEKSVFMKGSPRRLKLRGCLILRNLKEELSRGVGLVLPWDPLECHSSSLSSLLTKINHLGLKFTTVLLAGACAPGAARAVFVGEGWRHTCIVSLTTCRTALKGRWCSPRLTDEEIEAQQSRCNREKEVCFFSLRHSASKRDLSFLKAVGREL